MIDEAVSRGSRLLETERPGFDPNPGLPGTADLLIGIRANRL